MQIVPPPLYAYLATESDNLKLPTTQIPVALTATTVDVVFIEEDSEAFPPPSTTPLFEDGHYLLTAFDDWYYRIHFSPGVLSLGNLSGDQQRVLVLWNAFFNTVSFDDFVLGNAEGLSYEATKDPPTTLAPLELVTYTFSISANGPPVINATATWTIDGVEYVVPITGRRTVLFAFSPNWQQPVTETIEWKTTVVQTYSGLEQRVKIRDIPRRIFDYQLRVHEQHANNLDNLLFGWTGRMYALPLWHERNTLNDIASAGDETLLFNTFGCSYAVGQVVVLYRDSKLYELAEVLSVQSDSLTLVGPLINTWPAGTAVFPVLVSIPNEQFSTTRRVPTHIDAVVRMTANPTDVVARLPIAAAPATYRGEELFTLETNWITPLTVQVNARQKMVDNGQGPMRLSPKADFPSITRGMRWLLKNRIAAEELRAFFVRRKGRQVPVWMPSGANDFKLLEDVPTGQTSLLLRRNDYGSLIAGNAARRDVVFVMRSGARYPRRILAVEDDGDNSQMTIDSGLPLDVSPGDIKRISYLGLYRLGADAVSFTWQTAQVAEVQVNFVLIKGETWA